MSRAKDKPQADAGALSDDALAIARFVRLLLRGKWLIIASVIVCAGLAALAAWTMQPVYRAETTLAFVDDENDSGGLSALGGQLASFVALPGVTGASGSSRDEAMAILASRDLTREFIDKNNLLPALFPERWNDSTSSWRTDEGATRPTFGEAFRLFDEDIRRVDTDKATGLIKVSMKLGDPERAAQWTNQLVAQANERLRTSAIDEAQGSIEYLQAEAAKTSVVELQQAMYRLIEGQVQKIMLANVRREYAFKVLDPAVVPEPGEFVAPKRILLVALGVLLGGFLGVFVVIVRQAFYQLRVTDA